MPSALSERLQEVTGAISDAAATAGRDPRALTTIVVTKFHPASFVRELYELGVRDFGESRHQEAQPKIATVRDLTATWHFVGQVQTKKARQIRAYADVIHSVDRISLVSALEGEPVRRAFVQVNLTDDPGRGGVAPENLLALAEHVASAPGLELLGLMAVAPIEGEPRHHFARVRELSERLCEVIPTASYLSIGMSGDYRDAILEGATHLRIGTAITGKRPGPG